MIARLIAVVFAVASIAAAASPAAAQNSRSFVSGLGSDTNPCTLASPCRTFQRAHDATNANGEIDVLDSAGYGALVITKAISIINDGVGTASLVPTGGGTGISIQAGANDKVSLRGITVDGGGKGSNIGISFQSGKSLTIDRCNARNLFIGYAQGGGKVAISDSRFTDNSSTGVYITGGAATIERSAAFNNDIGFYLSGAAVQLSDVTASFNVSGIFSIGSETYLKDSVSSNNSAKGFYLNGGFAILTRNSINKNATYGVQRDQAGTIYSFGDNAINGNKNDVSDPLTKATLQ